MEGDLWKIPDGMRVEARRVAKGVRREIICQGDHLSTCEETDVGWLCDDACPVVDTQSVNKQITTQDDLIDVEKTTTRNWLRFTVKWKMTRVSLQRQFINGRCMKADRIYSRETWFSGTTRTKWGAKRQMRKMSEKTHPTYA